MPWRFVTPSKVTIATPVANLPRPPRKWLARGAHSPALNVPGVVRVAWQSSVIPCVGGGVLR